MKRMPLLIVTIFLCMLPPLWGDGVYLRLATSQGYQHPFVKACEYFSRLSSWETGGKVHIQVSSSGVLGDDAEALTQLRFGGVAFSLVDLQLLIDEVPSLSDLASTLKTLDRPAQLAYCQEHMETITTALQGNNIVPLAVFFPKLRCLYTNENRLKPMKECAIGVSSGSYSQEILRNLGAHPQLTVSSDAVAALSEHVVDAMEDAFVDFCISSNWAFARTVLVSEEESLPSFLLASIPSLDTLTEEQRKTLFVTAQKASLYGNTLLGRAETDWLKRAGKEKYLLENW